MSLPRIHIFDSTGEAYDSSQCDENIHNGDVLVVPSEKVVGFLLEAWPVAVTTEYGAFHQLGKPKEGETYKSIYSAMRNTLQKDGQDAYTDYSDAVYIAECMAEVMGATVYTR